jgi:alpha-galactosidase
MLAGWIGAPMFEVTFTCAGINHMAWYLNFQWNGQDAYPLIRQAITERPEVYNEEIVRNEMFLHLDYYITESSGHNSEYNWWFRKRPDLIEKYCIHGTGWNPGEYAYILKEYQKTETSWKNDVRVELAKEIYGTDLDRGQEYAAYIINALKGGEPFKFNGNVPNTQLVTNLPQGACVEVPVLADRSGIHPIYVGSLPPQCALLASLSSGIEELAIQGALTGDTMAIYHAICMDPLSAAVLSLAEIREMTNELFACHQQYLPQFKVHKV